ncbi:hypothetical protein CICLE_v10013180mg [Citrus x clementina]|uniref:Uncharacterized protein n=1 Tax=Citrus clementina TaxID=85681 RepID=V4S9Q3_CITCL|nr:hypothetical protein CICLE_v10013180mg [Citrus x clementina]
MIPLPLFLSSDMMREREREEHRNPRMHFLFFHHLSLSRFFQLSTPAELNPSSTIMFSYHYSLHHHHCSHFIPTQLKTPSLRKRLLEKQISPRNVFHVCEMALS